MSLELKKHSIKTGEKICETSFEERIEQDITLPDYCADIKKILRCSVIPGIHSVSLSGEKATAKGTGVIRVLYLAEGDKADVFEKSIDLSASVTLKEIPADAVVRAKSTADFVNCRATSQRKLNISSGVSTIFTCFGGSDAEFAVKGDAPVQTKTEKLTGENHLGYFDKTFDMSETVVLNSDYKPIGKIVGCTYRCDEGQNKLSSGKLLVKGELVTDVCYLCENSDNEFGTVTHKMPVSQIIDVRELPDGAVCDVSLKVSQLNCNVKADSSGSNRMLELSARVNAFVTAQEKKECEVITDCYCTDFETEESFDVPAFRCLVREIQEKGQAKGEVSLPSSAKEICFAKCLDVTHNAKFSVDGVRLDCSALVMIMYLDESGVPCCCEKNLDFDFNYAIVKKCNEPYGSFDLEPLSVTASLDGRDKAELIFDYSVRGKIYCKFDKKVLKGITVFNDKPKKEKGAVLTVYFGEKGEELWEIARLHNTTVEAILQENNIKKDVLEENSMLMIPCV